MLVKPDVARGQLAAAERRAKGSPDVQDDKGTYGVRQASEAAGRQPEPAKLPRRFFGTVALNPDRAARDMGDVAEEVLQNLTTLPGAKVRVTVEIEAEFPEGVAADTQRVVDENCRTLGFETHGFEES